jgi:hypothetical protein
MHSFLISKKVDDKTVYLSLDDGWTDKDSATRFGEDELNNYVSFLGDVQVNWISRYRTREPETFTWVWLE